jgi:AraC-like DNA-binding protein
VALNGDVPCYSARFVQSFAQVLSRSERFPAESLSQLKAIDPTTRIPVTAANDGLLQQVEQSGDTDLGLKAGRLMPLGGAGGLSYAMHTASTIRESLELASRFGRLFSDSLEIRLEFEGGRTMLLMDLGLAPARPVADFTMSAWFTKHLRDPLGTCAGVECWFAHPKPADVSEYEETFGPATLRFDAPSYGFVFDSEYLNAPLPSADPILHAVLCEHVGLVFAQLSRRRTLATRVREVTIKELALGTPAIFTVARKFRMSPRSLGRKLEREGTTFSALLDDVRRELAERYVGSQEIAFAQIAFQLRFAHVEAFYRAFKRWTGLTPLKYRRAKGLVGASRAPSAPHSESPPESSPRIGIASAGE